MRTPNGASVVVDGDWVVASVRCIACVSDILRKKIEELNDVKLVAEVIEKVPHLQAADFVGSKRSISQELSMYL
jgi:hypothetical protein